MKLWIEKNTGPVLQPLLAGVLSDRESPTLPQELGVHSSRAGGLQPGLLCLGTPALNLVLVTRFIAFGLRAGSRLQ